MKEEELSKLWNELEDEEKKAEVEYCKMFNSTPEEVPLNEMVRFRSGYCMGRHYGYLVGLHEGQKENNRLKEQIEKTINEIDKTMITSNMREREIYDIQEIFREYNFRRDSNDKWELKHEE